MNIIIGLIILLSIVGVGYKIVKAEKAQQKRGRRQHKLADQQTNVGNRIYNALKKAADEDTTGTLNVRKNTENPAEYSIIVLLDLEERQNNCLSVAFRVKVHLAQEKAISVIDEYGSTTPYGADEESLAVLIPLLQNQAREALK